MHTPAARRIDDSTLKIENPQGIDITLFANDQVPIDPRGISEILSFAGLSDTVRSLNRTRFFGDLEASMGRIVLTPDFHRGAGIPIGTVFEAHGFLVPKVVGSDIGCGMRLLALDVDAEEVEALGPELDGKLRHVFFEGGRDIAMSARQREAMLRDGLQGLVEQPCPKDGIWTEWDREQQFSDVFRTHYGGCFDSTGVFMADEYMKGAGGAFSHDDQMGSKNIVKS